MLLYFLKFGSGCINRKGRYHYPVCLQHCALLLKSKRTRQILYCSNGNVISHYVYDVLVVSLIGNLYDHHILQKAATAKQEAVR